MSTSIDDDPWERLERARARRLANSPFRNRPAAQEDSPARTEPDTQPTKPASKPARRPRPARPRTGPRNEYAPRLSPGQEQQLIELAGQGLSAPRIAEELNMRPDAVRSWAKHAGIALVDGRSQPQNNRGRTASWDVEEASRLAQKGLTAKQIAARVGAKTETVRRTLKRHGVSITSSYPRRDG